MSRKVWTSEEEKFIKDNLADMDLKVMCEKLNVRYVQLTHKIHRLGLSKKSASGENWTKEDDDLLAKHFKYAPKNYLMKLFPNRTWPAILQRGLKTLKLNRESQDRYSIDYNFFSKWTPESAYIFGFIAADGYVFYEDGIDNKNGLQFELAGYDMDILKKIKKILKYEGPILYSKRDTVKLQINNKKIVKDLIDKGMPSDNKTFDIKYPKTLPDNLVNHFIRGVFDGDGSVIVKKHSLSWQLLGTESLLKTIKSKLPIDTSNIHIQDRNKHGVNVFALQISNKNSIDLFNWMYEDATIYLGRKYKKYIDYINNKTDDDQIDDKTSRRLKFELEKIMYNKQKNK